jgi:hypothetical protein
MANNLYPSGLVFVPRRICKQMSTEMGLHENRKQGSYSFVGVVGGTDCACLDSSDLKTTVYLSNDLFMNYESNFGKRDLSLECSLWKVPYADQGAMAYVKKINFCGVPTEKDYYRVSGIIWATPHGRHIDTDRNPHQPTRIC